jgi:hypothetical protein
LLWWTVGGLAELAHAVPDAYEKAALLGFAALTASGCSEIHRRLQLSGSKVAALSLLPVMLLLALTSAGAASHPFASGGWAAWPAAFSILYWLMSRHEGPHGKLTAKVLHVPAAWLLCALLGWELSWDAGDWIHGSDAWSAAAWAIVPVVALFSLPKLATRVAWPFIRHRDTYLLIVGTGLAGIAALWSLATNFLLDGAANPLPYVPLVNPLDLMQAFVLLALWRFRPLLKSVGAPQEGLAALGFIWLNGVLLRSLHQWAGVPYTPTALLASTLVETALSIFWTVLALVTMLLAVRGKSRPAWVTGAVLLAVVIVKLFFVDLSRSGSIERIVSFVGVGLLIMVIGFFSPMPPAQAAQAARK